MTDIEQDEPDLLLSDLLKTMKANRADIIGQLANRHRHDGVADHSLMLMLTVCQTCITALEQDRDQW